MIKRILGFVFILISFGLGVVHGQTQTESDQQFISKIESALVKLVEMQKEIKDIHPFLSIFHPIAMLEEAHLFIFDYDSLSHQYRFQKKAPVPFQMTKGIRAAFPLSVNDGKPTCIVSEEIFDNQDGYTTIFHEFMHCNQANSCEYKLKKTLEISRLAAETNNYAWELNHAFPYQASVFVEYYSAFLDALDRYDHKTIMDCRTQLKKYLSQIDYEYMVWQEWKEGFARLIENRIRAEYDLDVNLYGLDKPYDRIAFYSGGARFIDYLTRDDEALLVSIESLFRRMQEYPDGD